MRKLLFFPLALMALNVLGQSGTEQPWRPEFIVPVQIGIDSLKNGKANVALTKETRDEMKDAQASPDYVVVLTPKGDCGPLSLVETKETFFAVKEQKGSMSPNGIFNYVVYVKQRMPQSPPRPPELTPEQQAEHQKQLPPPPRAPGQPPSPAQPGQ